MAMLFAKLVVAYLLGSVSGSLLLGRWRGLDVRAHGSGNAGGTNALRVAGWRFALGVILIDVGKGALAAWLGAWSADSPALTDMLPAQVACAFAAVIGHCWPVFFGFRGGKGAGTLVGAVLVIAPVFALGMFIVWIGVILICGYVGLATVIAAVTFPVLVLAADHAGYGQPSALVIFSSVAALFIIYTHRSNLLRMWRHEEPRLRRGSRT